MNELGRILDHAQRMVDELRARRYITLAPLQCEAYLTREPQTFEARHTGERRELRPGDRWGEAVFDCAWMHITGNVPENVPENARVDNLVVRVDIDGEALVVDIDGAPVRGLTTVCSSFDMALGKPGKTDIPLGEVSSDGQRVDFWLDCGYNDLFGRVPGGGVFEMCELCFDRPMLRQLIYDMELLIDLARQLPERSVRYAQIARTLELAMRVLGDITDSNAEAAALILASELKRDGGDYGFTISAMGHAHIDLMWLWPRRETVRKAQRTFATALRNIEKYENYVFGASQPQLYQWVSETAPQLFDAIVARAGEGRWEPVGAMWVEADVMMPSGESLSRQLLYGQRFWQKEFGDIVNTLWLPDSFGYSAQLPQLMRLSGVEYFMNMRAGLNDSWEFPHSSFWWQGLDGSKVLTHVLPEGTYNSAALPHSALKLEQNFKEAGLSDCALMLYGIGDGGGGPGEEHIERVNRSASVLGMPPVMHERAGTFFERLRASADQLPTWVGEMFVDQFQGTYTSQLDIKCANRHIENRLRASEIIFTAIYLAGGEYPREQLERAWKRVLAYQFHDSLPGTCIGRVYDEAKEDYADINRGLDELLEHYWGDEAVLQTAFNPHSWTVDMWLEPRHGQQLGENEALRMTLPPLSSTATVSARRMELPTMIARENLLENDRLRVNFDDRGYITGLLDKRQGWQVLNGLGNRLNVYEDDGDAWRIGFNAFSRRCGSFIQMKVSCETSGAYVRRRAEYRFNRSTLTQTITLTAGSARIDFENEIDWQENGRILRAEFPIELPGGRFLCDAQYGYVERPTGRGTPREAGMYEVNALKWADLYRTDRGVALMLDGGYGHSCAGSLMSLSLVRSPSYPDPQADRGKHTLRYAIYPHMGDITDAVRQACTFHQPPQVFTGGTFGPLCWLDTRNVVLDAIKLAEDSDDIVLRMYECTGAGCVTTLKTGFSVREASECDILEREVTPLESGNDGIVLSFKPFEIKTLLITPDK